jgi:hypothetical protein
MFGSIAQLMSHKKPPEPGQVPCDSAFLAVQFQNAEFEIGVAFQRVDGYREDCLTAAQNMTSGRVAGKSKHWASTAGGRSVRACQRPNVSAHTVADRQFDTLGGRLPRHLGEVARNGPTLTRAKSMRDIPRRF